MYAISILFADPLITYSTQDSESERRFDALALKEISFPQKNQVILFYWSMISTASIKKLLTEKREHYKKNANGLQWT
jgi:hypothetical protein